jgi:hypothetical protein
MSANTAYVLDGPLTLDNHGNPGTFGVTNRSPIGVHIGVSGMTATGSQSCDLNTAGATFGIDLDDVASLRITADSYPVTILLLYTPLDLDLEAAPTADPGQPPVYITGAGMAVTGGTDSQTGTAPGAANVGATELGYRIAKAGDPATWALVMHGTTPLGAGEIVLVEYPAAGGSPVKIDGAGTITNQPSTGGGSTTGSIPDVSTTGATLDIVAVYDDPDYAATAPAGFSIDVAFPRPGVPRIAAAIASKAGAGGTGLAFGGGGAETQWKTARATFRNVTRPAVQTATGFCSAGDAIVVATFAAPPTAGNLIVAWYCFGQGTGELVASLRPLAP